MIGLFAFSLALASDPGPVGSRTGEYQRLSEDMGRMALVGNWLAVERSFARLNDLGHPHTYKVLLNAAYAAREVGNVTLARQRLLAAAEVKDDAVVDQWLAAIQSDYAFVMLAADLPDNYRLVPANMPFDPEHRKAVAFAQRSILEESFFEGYVPKGVYTFQPLEPEEDSLVYKIDLRRERTSVDLRTHVPPTGRDRRRRARIDRRLERASGE